MAANYADPEQPKIKDVLTFFTNFCKYMAHELFKNPFIRKSIKPLYHARITLCTEPTQKGKTEIDMYNINSPVKRIHMRSVLNLKNEIWFLALENEQKRLIKTKFVFPWHSNNERDEILQKLQDLYLAPMTETAEKDNITQWNILRKEIITLLLGELYPHYEKILREELKSEGERYLIEYCGQRFRKMIFAAPYPKSVDEENTKSGAGPRVLSFVPDQTGSIQLAMVDGYGELQDHMILNYFLISLKCAPEEFKVRNSAEKEQLKKLIARYKPDLIVIGTNHLNAKMIHQVLRDPQKGGWGPYENPWITFEDITVPRIYAKMDLSNKGFKEYSLRLREAISLARLQQNPLAEILRLWNDRVEDNGLMQITFHHLQKYVDQVRLKNEYEKVCMEVCNSVGFDINKALQHRHLVSPLQFICGLGPRRSHHVMEKIIEKFEKLRLRLELFTFKIVEKNVYINMCGFIIVHNYDDEDEFDLLDTTRIQPESKNFIHALITYNNCSLDYQLAKKIAKDALDEPYDERTVDLIEKIMSKPHKLEELDLEDYAAHLESKGKHNMSYVFDFIVMELARPFGDPRGARREMNQKDLFYKLTKETPFSLQYGMIVTCRVVKVDRKSLLCRLECGVDATIASGDIYDNNNDKEKDLKDDFKEGMVLKARVKKLSFENFITDEGMSEDFTQVKLTIRPKDLAAHKKYIKHIHHGDIQESFKIKDDEDFSNPVDITTKGLGNKYKMRKINHLKFKNISYQGALDHLADKEVGDFVIRPSSKGDGHLTITWKFYDNIYVHLDIKEGIKAPNEQIAKRLMIGNETFEGLEEIILGYINPCNNIITQVINHRKFDKGDFDLIESKLKKDKELEPKIIPYLFSLSSEAPQYLILSYIPKAKDVVREYIKVKPKGLVFHDQVYTNLNALIAWFKANYKNQEYHKYLKHARVLIALRSTARAEKAEARGLDFVKADDGTFKVKEDRTAIKKEPNYNAGSIHIWEDNDRRSFSRGRSIEQNRNRSMSKSRGTPFKGGDSRRDRRPGESPGVMSGKSRNDNRSERVSEARSPWSQDQSRQRDRSSQREWHNQSERSRASRDFSTGRSDRGGPGGRGPGRDGGRGVQHLGRLEGGRDGFENKGRYEKGGRSDSNFREKHERSRSKSWEKDKKSQRGNESWGAGDKARKTNDDVNKTFGGSENRSFIINNSNPKSNTPSQNGWTQDDEEIDY